MSTSPMPYSWSTRGVWLIFVESLHLHSNSLPPRRYYCCCYYHWHHVPKTAPSSPPELFLQRRTEQSSPSAEAPEAALPGAAFAARVAVLGTAGSAAVVRSVVAADGDELPTCAMTDAAAAVAVVARPAETGWRMLGWTRHGGTSVGEVGTVAGS